MEGDELTKLADGHGRDAGEHIVLPSLTISSGEYRFLLMTVPP